MVWTASNLGQLALGGAVAAGVALTAIVVVPKLGAAPVALVATDLLPEPATVDPVGAETSDVPVDAALAAPVPTFDHFSVKPDGSAVVAGRAEPGQSVDILLDTGVVASAMADETGAFVALFDIAAADTPRTLTLLADPENVARASSQVVLVEPFGVPQAAEISVIAEADVAEISEPNAAETNASIASVSTPDATQPIEIKQEPQAPAVLIADEDGVRVLQASAADTSPQVMATVALDTITYDPTGEVLLAGRAISEGFVQIYLDNQPVTTSRISASGQWRTDLPQVDTGIYTLRIDEVNADGTVISRVETPFLREEPAVIAAQMADETAVDGFRVAVKTVQPGATLWAIAREQFGDGIMYVAVYEANRDLIRNPDLIYPGQVFRMPVTSE